MNTRQIFGALMTVAGVIGFITGMSERNQFDYQLVSAFGGNTSGVAVLIVGSAILAIIGVILLVIPSTQTKQPIPRRPERRSEESESEQLCESVRGFNDDRLSEIVGNAMIYTPELVAACKKEIEVRDASRLLMPTIKEYPDSQLREVIKDSANYNDVMLYCCRQELDSRRRVREVQRAEEEEKERIVRAEKAAADAAKNRELAATKKKKLVKNLMIFVPIIVVAGAVMWFTSNSYKYRSGCNAIARAHYEKGIDKLSGIKPSSGLYTQAQYNLYRAYLSTRDSMNAAGALKKSLSNNNWEHDDAYTTYTDYLLDGSFAPYIERNEVAAAEYYLKSPQMRYYAGELFFKKGQYEDAYSVFSDFTDYEPAQGYIGIMRLYGLAGLDRSLVAARNAIMKAPDEPPFLVHKGDLSLFGILDGKHISIQKIEQAKSYYDLALVTDPENEAILQRRNAVQNMIASNEKQREQFTNTWDSYSFTYNNDANTGAYVGEVSYDNWTKYPGGWGCFAWEDGAVAIGKYSSMKLNGPGLSIQEWHYEGGSGHWYEVAAGTFVSDELQSGVYVNRAGDISIGTFRNGKLTKGVVRDLNGNLLNKI